MEGTGGSIIFNVMSRQLLSADAFIGQAVVDLAHYSMLRSGQELAVNLGLHGSPEHPTFSSSGQAEVVRPTEGGGVLKLKLQKPSRGAALCGWMFLLTKSVFGVMESRKVWAVIYEDLLNLYNSPYCGALGLVRSVGLSNICRVNTSELEVASTLMDILVTITFKPLDFSSDGTELVLAWGDDLRAHRGLWLRRLQSLCESAAAFGESEDTSDAESVYEYFSSATSGQNTTFITTNMTASSHPAAADGADVITGGSSPMASSPRRRRRRKRKEASVIAVGRTPVVGRSTISSLTWS